MTTNDAQRIERADGADRLPVDFPSSATASAASSAPVPRTPAAARG
ncbi:hypothetical protein ABZ446_10480 [Streptomyces sp. NPDC005813]